MLRFGICNAEEFLRLGEQRRYVGARVAYSLLDIGDNPSSDQVRLFEDISFTLRTSNGTFRTTKRNRFPDVNEAATRAARRLFPADAPLRAQDRAASHGLTSVEWAAELFEAFPNASLEASDLMAFLIELTLPSGEVYIAEANGAPLQYIRPPFVVSVQHEPRRFPVNVLLGRWARRRFSNIGLAPDWIIGHVEPGYRVRRIPFVHPEARRLAGFDRRFTFEIRSVFDTVADECDMLRTMNILIPAYFSETQLVEGIEAARNSVREGGLWIVGRTGETDFVNRATVFRKHGGAWEPVERIGGGSELDTLILQRPVHA